MAKRKLSESEQASFRPSTSRRLTSPEMAGFTEDPAPEEGVPLTRRISELPGQALTAMQDVSLGRLREVMGLQGGRSPAQIAASVFSPTGMVTAPMELAALAGKLGGRAAGGPTPAHVLAGRYMQAVDPLAGGSRSEQVFEEEPVLQAAYRGGEAIGHPAFAGAQFGAQLAANVPDVLAGAGAAARELPGLARQPLTRIAQKTVMGGAVGAGIGGGGAFLGAPEGQRGEEGFQAATSPWSIALGAVPGALGEAGLQLARRRQQRLAAQQQAAAEVSAATLQPPIQDMAPASAPQTKRGPMPLTRGMELTSPGKRRPADLVLTQPGEAPRGWGEPPTVVGGPVPTGVHRLMIADVEAAADRFMAELGQRTPEERELQAARRREFARAGRQTVPGAGGPSSGPPTKVEGVSTPTPRGNEPAATPHSEAASAALPSRMELDPVGYERTALTPGKKAKRSRQKAVTVTERPPDFEGYEPTLATADYGTPQYAQRSIDDILNRRQSAGTERLVRPDLEVAAGMQREKVRAEESAYFSERLDRTVPAGLVDESARAIKSGDFGGVPRGGAGGPGDHAARIAFLQARLAEGSTQPGRPGFESVTLAKVRTDDPIGNRRGEGPPRLPPEQLTAVATPDRLDQLREASRAVEAEVRLEPRTVEAPAEVVPPFPRQLEAAPPEALQAVVDAQQMAQRWLRREQGWWEKLRRFAALPEQRAAARGYGDVADAVRSWESAARLQDVQVGRLFPVLRAIEKKFSPQMQQRIKQFVAQSVSPERLGTERRIPVEALPAEWRALFEAGVEQNNLFRDQLAYKGYFSPAQIARMVDMDTKGVAWLHRDYRLFQQRGYQPRNSSMQRAIDFFTREGLPADQAAAQVVSLLSSFGEGTAETRWRQSQLNRGILKPRKDVPPELREVMGEIHNPAFAVAVSMSEVERLWRQSKVSETFTAPEARGRVWDEAFSPAMHHTPIPGEVNGSRFEAKRTYGEFAGKYLAPELYEAVMQAPTPAVQNVVNQALAHFAQVFKFSKIGLSPISWMRDAVSNFTSMAAAGLPLWNYRLTPRLRQAWKAIGAYNENFLTPLKGPESVTDGAWVQKAYEYGALRPGLGAEFAGGSRARALAAKFLKDPRQGFFGMLEKLWAEGQIGVARLGEVRELADMVPRLAVFIEQVSKGRERLGLDMPTAYARAARLVNENFISAGNIGHGMRNLSRQAGFIAPFMSWHADNIRVHSNWVRNAGRGFGPGGVLSGQGSAQAFNVATHYALIAGLSTALARAFGLTDADQAAGEAALRTGWQRYNPFRVWLPGRDAKGRLRAVALGAVMPTAVFAQGGQDNWLSRVAGNTLRGFVSSTPNEDAVNRGLALIGMGEDDFKPRDPLPGESPTAALRAGWQYIEPGLVRDVRNVLRRTEMTRGLGRFEETLTPGQAASRFTPFPVEPVGSFSSTGARQQERVGLGKTQGQQRLIGKLPLTGEEKAPLRSASREELGKVRGKSTQRSKAGVTKQKSR